MSFLTRPPSRRLSGIVERLWRVEESQPSLEPEAICPDGRPEIVIHLGDPMRGQPRYLLVGQMAAPLSVVATGRVLMLGARLSPTGLHRLLAMPQDRLAGHVLTLDSVWAAWTRRAVDRVSGARSPASQLQLFEQALEELVRPDAARDGGGPATAAALQAALHLLDGAGGSASIAAAAAHVGLGRRQFERRFREHVGLPPRLYARIVRFQRAFQSLGQESGAAIAARCGYADQAHLVREVRRFAGQTPGALAAAEGLTAFFRD